MWKRDEAVRAGERTAGARRPRRPCRRQPRRRGRLAPRSEPQRDMEKDIVNIGKSVVIKGELNGSEDLTIEGHVEGTIQLRDHVLTIGPNGKIKAQVFAKSVIVLGEVTGNVTASDKVDIRDNGSVDGDIISPRVAIAEGAHFRGSVDMQRAGAGASAHQAQPKRRTRRSPPPRRAEPACSTQPRRRRYGQRPARRPARLGKDPDAHDW